jgi:hypothetical protein
VTSIWEVLCSNFGRDTKLSCLLLFVGAVPRNLVLSLPFTLVILPYMRRFIVRATEQ